MHRIDNDSKNDEKILFSQIMDKVKFAKQNEKIQYTDFLDMYQVSITEKFMKKNNLKNYFLYGGFDNAERKILIIYPEDYTMDMVEKNYSKIINVIRITLPEDEKGKYSHRNYLGGIIKLGIERKKVGDILVSDEGADILVKEETCKSLQHELGTLTRFQHANIEIIELSEIKKQEIKLEKLTIIIPSLRLDNFVSNLAKTSRNNAVEIINSERVFINGQNEMKPSKPIKEGDILTIRGKGRFIIKEFSGTTKSGRTIVEVEKYV